MPFKSVFYNFEKVKWSPTEKVLQYLAGTLMLAKLRLGNIAYVCMHIRTSNMSL